MLNSDIEVRVLTCGHKPSITSQFLQDAGIQYRVCMNADWDLPHEHPERWEDRSSFPPILGYALRQYRAFRGHQEICRQAEREYTLVFEDDANPLIPVEEWTRFVNRCKAFIGDALYDAVSFHGRDLSPLIPMRYIYGRELGQLQVREKELSEKQRYFLRPAFSTVWAFRKQIRWHEGCLAYLIGPKGRKLWLDAGHGSGVPCDLFLANGLHTLVLAEDQTIFKHDEEHGSLIGNRGTCRRRLEENGEPKP
jgi:hypothetical protein